MHVMPQRDPTRQRRDFLFHTRRPSQLIDTVAGVPHSLHGTACSLPCPSTRPTYLWFLTGNGRNKPSLLQAATVQLTAFQALPDVDPQAAGERRG